jgi:predicted dinucleotide-binding enzyme
MYMDVEYAERDATGQPRPPPAEAGEALTFNSRGTKVRVAMFTDAAAHGEIVINATSGTGSLQALNLAGERNLSGKILIDVSNPLDFSKGFRHRSRCATPTRSPSRSSVRSRRRRS